MNPVTLIRQAIAEGLEFSLVPTGGLRVKGSSEAVRRWLPVIKQEKAGILASLEADRSLQMISDWQAYFDARVLAGGENGRLAGVAAMRNAYACCIAEWLDQAFEPSATSVCALGVDCRRPHCRILPFGLEDTGYVWLHPECRPLWAARKRIKAVKALAAAGVHDPVKFPEDFGKNGGA